MSLDVMTHDQGLNRFVWSLDRIFKVSKEKIRSLTPAKVHHHVQVLSIRQARLQLAIKENYGFTSFNVRMHCRDSLFVVNNKLFAKCRGLLMPHQLLSPSFQRVTLFLPLGGSRRELLRGAVSVQTSLSLGLLPGQVALLIAGSE